MHVHAFKPSYSVKANSQNLVLAFLQEKVSRGSLLLAPRSVLLLEGRDITIKNLRVDGALVVRAAPGAQVVIDGLTVSNAGWTWTPLEEVSLVLFRVIIYDS